jgi:predicted Fe-S protein YdhL (DUF1289 family)
MYPEDRRKHPCNRVCNGWMREDGICSGCYRDIDQVRDWNVYSEEEKEEQIKIIEKRQKES